MANIQILFQEFDGESVLRSVKILNVWELDPLKIDLDTRDAMTKALLHEFDKAQARAVIKRAERDLGKLSDGQKTDLLIDNMPSIRSVDEAKFLLAVIK